MGERFALSSDSKPFFYPFFIPAKVELLNEDFDVLVVVDADSRVSPNFIDEIKYQFAQGAHAVQVPYRVGNPEASMRTRLMHIALMAFNILRPRSRAGFGLSAGIFGNGFALSVQTLKKVPYLASSIVEDVEYHLRLIQAGYRVTFVSNTSVYADMPIAGSGVKTQRTRWEGGRFRLLRELGPQLFKQILTGDFRKIEPLLDLMLLPLAFHTLLLALVIFIPGFAWYGCFSFAMLTLHILTAIVVSKGRLRDLSILAVVPFYLLWKITLVPSLFKTARKNATWIRTERLP